MESEATEVSENFKAFLLRMAESFKLIGALRDEEYQLREIAESVDQTFTLAVFGRVKTGKSSIINALVGRPLTITGVEEATATLNWILFGDNTQTDSAVVHWKDGRVESIPLSRISEWAGKNPETLKRVRDTRFLQLFDNAPFLRDIHIVDVPGTGATVDEHEQVAREFLSTKATEESEVEGKKADALVYVFSGDGRASDHDTLAEFRQTRLPGSDPYNSIGVLHLWETLDVDDVFSEAKRKAGRLHKLVGDVVSEVIPVSAPLALVAKDAPDSYFERLLELTSQESLRDVLMKKLSLSDRWEKDEARKSAYRAYKLPWASFVQVVKLLLDHSCESAEDARRVCLNASGFKQLETALQNRFFKRAALIKQRLARVKTKRPIQLGLMKLNEQLELLSSDLDHYTALLDTRKKGDTHHAWLTTKTESCRQQLNELDKHAVKLDRNRLDEENHMNLIEGDLAFLEAIDQHPDWIENRDNECIRSLLTIDRNKLQDESPSQAVLEAMLRRYGVMMQSPEKEQRDQFEHLIRRLHQALHNRISHSD